MTILEQLKQIDRKQFENEGDYYGLATLYEAVRLSPEDKEEIRKVLQATNDAEAVAAVLQTKAAATNEDLAEDVDDDVIDCEDDFMDADTLDEAYDTDVVAEILSGNIMQPKRGFKYLSSNGDSGEVLFQGSRYAFRRRGDGTFRVMRASSAGNNWSETLFAEDIDNPIQKKEVFHNDNGIDYDIIERSKSGKNALLQRGNQWIIAWNCPENNQGSWGQGHYFFDEKTARKAWEDKYLNESLNENTDNEIVKETSDYRIKREKLNGKKDVYSLWLQSAPPREPRRWAPTTRDFDSVKEAEDYYNKKYADESLNEARSLAKPFKKDLKNTYKSFDRQRDYIRKKNAAMDAKIDHNRNELDMDISDDAVQEIKDFMHEREPKWDTYKSNVEHRMQGLESDTYPFYVTYYVEVPYYHPEEGGYYVAGVQAEQSTGYNTRQEARQAAAEYADEMGFEKLSADDYRLYSKYIGDSEYICVEPANKYLSREEGDHVYESLKEDWVHFSFKSGANPYIAKSQKEANRVIKKYGKHKVKKLKDGFYEIDDEDDYSFWDNESLKEGIDVESTGKNRMPLYMAKDAIKKFNDDAKAYPYWVIKTDKWYDPEGLNIPNKEYKIEYAGTYDECNDKLKQLINSIDNDWRCLDKAGKDFVTIYYPHAIAKATFSIIKNPFLVELKEDFDSDLGHSELRDDDYVVASDDIQFDTAENLMDVFGEDSEYLQKLYDLGLDDMSGDFYIPEGTRLKFVGETHRENDGSTMYQLQIDGDPNKEILVCDYTVEGAVKDGKMVIDGSVRFEESLREDTEHDRHTRNSIYGALNLSDDKIKEIEKMFDTDYSSLSAEEQQYFVDKYNNLSQVNDLLRFIQKGYKDAFSDGNDLAWKRFYNSVKRKVDDINKHNEEQIDVDAIIDYALEQRFDESLEQNSESHPVNISDFKFTNYRNPDGQNRHGYETYRSALENVSKEIESLKDRVIKTYWGEMPPAEQFNIECQNIFRHSTVRDMIGSRAEQGLRDAWSALRRRAGYLAKELEKYKKWDKNKRQWVESMTEDTVKQNGKWVNKGKEGTHGKFTTKKKADAQRKAMFANGYKESMSEGLQDIHNDFEAARRQWNSYGFDVSLDDALEMYNEVYGDEDENFYAKPIYNHQAWTTMVRLVSGRTDTDVLEYDDDAYDSWGGLFDVSGPQELANDMGKKVRHKDKIYTPQRNESLLETDKALTLNEDGYKSVIADLESIEKFLRDNDFYNYDVADYDVYPMGTSKIDFEISGDWKHDHLNFKFLIDEWADENNRKIFKIDSEEIGDSDSDDYTAIYHVYVTKDDDAYDKLNSMMGLFSESLDANDKQYYINEIKEAEDLEDLEDIVHEIYSYDKGLFVQLRHFPKDKSFEEIRDHMIDVLQRPNALGESLNESIDSAKAQLNAFIEELIEEEKSHTTPKFRDTIQTIDDAVSSQEASRIHYVEEILDSGDAQKLSEAKERFMNILNEYSLPSDNEDDYLWEKNFYRTLIDICSSAMLEESLKEDYQHQDDTWGTPYTYDEVEDDLQQITNNWTDKDGLVRCYWEQEKEYGKQILQQHYKVVEVSDGRTGKGENMSWAISYAEPKQDLA